MSYLINHSAIQKRICRFSIAILLLCLILSSCHIPNNDAAAIIAEPTVSTDDLMATAQFEVAASIPTPIPPTPTAAPEEVPPEPTIDPNLPIPTLPEVFVFELLNPRDVPHTYEADVCKFLKNRWDSGKAIPGTVVMIIMYHSIVSGDETAVRYDNQVSSEKHNQMMENLKAQGFEAIDMSQFVNFMLNNDYIPERSALIISDDRHHEGYWRDHFKPYFEKYGWRVVNAWISAPDTTAELSSCETSSIVKSEVTDPRIRPFESASTT